MKIKDMQYWKTLRKIGKKKYVLKYFISVGAFLVVLNVLNDIVIKKRRFNSSSDYKSFFLDLLLEIAVYLIVCYVFGVVSWNQQEKQYEDIERSKRLQNVKINYCYFCGEKIEEDAKVCPKCGKELDA